MNQIDTLNDGGFPEKLDDWRWINAGLLDAFKGLVSPFGSEDQTAVILSGCTFTVAPTPPTPTVTWTPGYVSIGGEICYFPGQSHTVPAPNFAYWKIDITTDPTGLKSFQDGSSHETYQVRRAKIEIDSVIPSGYTEAPFAKRYFDIIREKVKVPGWNVIGSGVGEQQVRYLKNIDGFVQLAGACTFTLPSLSNYLLFTLPAGFRPEFPKYFNILILPYDPADIALCRIDTDGKVWLINAPYTGVMQVHLEQIPPFQAFY